MYVTFRRYSCIRLTTLASRFSKTKRNGPRSTSMVQPRNNLVLIRMHSQAVAVSVGRLAASRDSKASTLRLERLGRVVQQTCLNSCSVRSEAEVAPVVSRSHHEAEISK